MRFFILICLSPVLIIAMQNNHYIPDSYLTTEIDASGNTSCVLHVPKSRFMEQSDMTFVHKNGMNFWTLTGLDYLNTHASAIVEIAKVSAMNFFKCHKDKICFDNCSVEFKKPQVRIVHKTEVNCEHLGMFGNYVDTNFLRVKIKCSSYPKKTCAYFYVFRQDSELKLIPYKIYFNDNKETKIKIHKEMRYF